MALDKLVDSSALDSGLTSIANAIRSKGGTSAQLSFPSGMAAAIGDIQTGIEPGRFAWQQTPSAVQDYLDYLEEHPYSEGDYSDSVIEDYLQDTADERPIGQAVTTDAGTLEVGGYRKTVSAGSNMIYNAVPGIETPYSLISAGGVVKQAGTLKPNKPLRQIMASTHNVRDLGGWACDGGFIRYGKLFRGGEVSASADLDIFLDQLGVRAELDLQGTDGSDVSVLSGHVDYCCPDGGACWAEYRLDNRQQMKEAIGFVFRCVKAGKPLYFHCIAGADRTATIACLLESLLGVSASDIDADYELSSFYTWQDRPRERTYSGWVNLQTQIGGLTGTTRQDKAANYVASLGFTAAEINAFRSAMIDGTPSTLSPDIDTFTVTNDLTNAESDNPASEIDQYQPYAASITPEEGYVLSSVQILMGGVDVTEQVWSGEETNLYRSLRKTLLHCTINNSAAAVIDGQSFAAELTAENGYTFDGAEVQITMGGVDITDDVWITKEDE